VAAFTEHQKMNMNQELHMNTVK